MENPVSLAKTVVEIIDGADQVVEEGLALGDLASDLRGKQCEKPHDLQLLGVSLFGQRIMCAE